MFCTGYSSAGFLSYLSSDMSSYNVDSIPFDKVEYDEYNNYEPSTGVYTVPFSGKYLVQARLYVKSGDADHFINVNGKHVARTPMSDSSEGWYGNVVSSTSVVLHLLQGQQLTVEPFFPTSTIFGHADYMQSSFGATLLYVD